MNSTMLNTSRVAPLRLDTHGDSSRGQLKGTAQMGSALPRLEVAPLDTLGKVGGNAQPSCFTQKIPNRRSGSPAEQNRRSKRGFCSSGLREWEFLGFFHFSQYFLITN